MSKTIPAYVEGLRCRECGNDLRQGARSTSASSASARSRSPTTTRRIGKVLTRATIESRPHTMWRYAELLPHRRPAGGRPATSGMTPLVRADRLAKRLGLKEVWVKNDAVSYPTLSFKDRVVSVAISKAIEFGIGTIACASTGNLANATAAQAAAAGLPAVVLIPLRPRAGQDPRHQHLRRARRRRQRDVRRRQPALLGDRRQVRLGVRQREPAPVLRRGVEELRLRDRRAARLAAARRTSSCRWRAARW